MANAGELSALYKDLVWSRSIPGRSIIVQSMTPGPAFEKTFPLPTVLAVVWIHETRELEAVGMAEETGRRHLKCYEANGMTSRAHTARMQLTAQWKRGGSKISLGSISGSSISTPRY